MSFFSYETLKAFGLLVCKYYLLPHLQLPSSLTVSCHVTVHTEYTKIMEISVQNEVAGMCDIKTGCKFKFYIQVIVAGCNV